MGVLHTTIAGQPVFWVLFGVILLYTVIRKFRSATNGNAPVQYDSLNISFSVLWQLLFIVGLIMAPQFFFAVVSFGYCSQHCRDFGFICENRQPLSWVVEMECADLFCNSDNCCVYQIVPAGYLSPDIEKCFWFFCCIDRYQSCRYGFSFCTPLYC